MFSRSDRLGYAINYCIDGLEQTVKHLPKEATEEEIRECIRLSKISVGTLMTNIREIECEMEGKPINLENMTVDFFERIAKVRREA